MRRILQALSILALLATIVPSVLFLVGRSELSTVKLVLLVATVVWFGVAPFAWQREANVQSAGGSDG